MSNYLQTSYDKFIGFHLKMDVYNNYGVVILPAQTQLTKQHLDKLLEHNIQLTAEHINLTVREKERQMIDQIVHQAASFFDEIKNNKKLPLQDICQEVIPSIATAAEKTHIFRLFSFLQEGDDYTYRHNIAVGVISRMLGKWLQLSPEDLDQLTIAATLHDIGKMLLPLEILNKPGKLTAEEFNTIKQHTVLGYDLIKATPGTTHRQALVALQHHERQDGSGYPYGISGGAIDRFSRIVAVADVFHAMSCDRIYRNASPFYEILSEMQNQRFGLFDANIMGVFIEKMMQSLVGNRVEMTDKTVGQIVMINPHDPLRPLVQIEEEFIDLSRQRSIHIQRVIT